MRKLSDRIRQNGLNVQTIHWICVGLGVLFSLSLLFSVLQGYNYNQNRRSVTQTHVICERAAVDLQNSSDELSSQVTLFALIQDVPSGRGYFEEIESGRREEDVNRLRLAFGEDSMAYLSLADALDISNELAQTEYYAMKLTAEAIHLEPGEVPQLNDVQLSEEDLALSPQEKIALAQRMLTDARYRDKKTQIRSDVSICIEELQNHLEEYLKQDNETLRRLLVLQAVFALALFVLVVAVIMAINLLIIWPLRKYTSRITEHQTLRMAGASELRYLAKAYNRIFEENESNIAHLKFAAEHDPLTGLLNRGAFEKLYLELTQDVALLHIDIDNFREFNNDYGHDMGDAVLRKVSDMLKKNFRSSDFPFRTGGDEFVVIMTSMAPELRSAVVTRIEGVRRGLRETGDGLPPITLSIGVAFSGQPSETGDLYKDADIALYVVKERGRNGYAFYDDVGGGKSGADN